MSLVFTSLNSGSNGNCYYVANEQEAILIDAGLSCKETEKRMEKLSLSMRKIKAIFISHEHIDHIKGAEVLSKKYSIPIYITTETLKNSRVPIPEININFITLQKEIIIGSLHIIAFPKMHDAIEPCSFIIKYNNLTVGVFTDIGKVCDNVIKYFKQCHAAFLEANYDEDMLENGDYPYHLKKRISSDNGHLSNKEAFELFENHRPNFMSHLLLSHLSKENNTPELALELFYKNNNGVAVSIASRYEATELFELKETAIKKAAPIVSMQLTLF
jgi:phosphoribosyl 1,2-cyclic phosphodiesterase